MGKLKIQKVHHGKFRWQPLLFLDNDTSKQAMETSGRTVTTAWPRNKEIEVKKKHLKSKEAFGEFLRFDTKLSSWLVQDQSFVKSDPLKNWSSFFTKLSSKLPFGSLHIFRNHQSKLKILWRWFDQRGLVIFESNKNSFMHFYWRVLHISNQYHVR